MEDILKQIIKLSRSLNYNPAPVVPINSVTLNSYVSVVPTATSVSRLINFIRRVLDDTSIRKAMIDQLNAEAHVTIMYSKENGMDIKNVKDASILTTFNNPDTGLPWTGDVKKFEYWGGHNGSGYIVAILKSLDMVKLNKKWKKYKLEHSHDDYVPHITILNPADNFVTLLENMNNNLQYNPLRLEFVNEQIEKTK